MRQMFSGVKTGPGEPGLCFQTVYFSTVVRKKPTKSDARKAAKSSEITGTEEDRAGRDRAEITKTRGKDNKTE